MSRTLRLALVLAALLGAFVAWLVLGAWPG
jgi:hypothetical protein